MGRYVVALADSVEHPVAVGREQTDRHGGTLGFVYRYGPIGYSAMLPLAAVDALERDPRVNAVTADQLVVQFAQTTSTGIKRVYAFSNAALKSTKRPTSPPTPTWL